MTTVYEECNLCGVQKATGRCRHTIERLGQVIMSKRAHIELTTELERLRNLEGALADLVKEHKVVK